MATNKNLIVSIIIVHYKAKKELFACIDSIIKSKPIISYEIIVVDNDEKKIIEKRLKNKFPKIKYIKSPGNIGFGAGNNLGAKYAKAEFLFFFNPDTEISSKAIDILIDFLQKNPSVAVVAPIFIDRNNKPYPLQGSKRLTPLRAIFTLSFVYRLLPDNNIAKDYLLSDWNKTNVKEVDVVPGTGFVIRRNIFEKIGGFDENFFLYFEEFDLCNRVKKLGYKIYIVSDAKAKHLWGVSTKKANFDIKKIFEKSRFYYFKKHYGLFPAFIVEVFTRLNKIHLLLGFILALATFLRLYRLQELMLFIGDQGWFYLSARDMLLTGNIPLVGIASSHVWMHQGPLWTYLLSLFLWVFKFNPLSGGYLSVLIDVFSVYLIYSIGKMFFSQRVGVISSILYATSPLVIGLARFPYHTSPIPLFSLLFLFAFTKWIKGNLNYFPLAIFILAVLYNLEIATFSLFFCILVALVYGLLTKKKWTLKLISIKNIFFSFVAFVIPMFPFLVYDVYHGFPQTLKFIAWIGYRILVFFGFINLYPNISPPSLSDFFYFLGEKIMTFVFLPNKTMAILILLVSITIFTVDLFRQIRLRKNLQEYVSVSLILVVTSLGFFIAKTPSDAYLPVFFPVIIFSVALGLEDIYRRLRLVFLIIIFTIIAGNTFSYIDQLGIIEKSGHTFKDKLSISNQILKYAKGKRYNLIGDGPGSQFESFTMNYEYLTWWLGHAPSKNNIDITVVISELKNGINIRTINE